MRRSRAGSHRHAFTIMEMLVVSVLMSLLVTFLASAWRAFLKPALYAESVCRVAIEARMARETLARDFSGSAPEGITLCTQDGQTGALDYRLQSATPGNQGTELNLQYMGSNNQYIYVTYKLEEYTDTLNESLPKRWRLVRQCQLPPCCYTSDQQPFIVAKFIANDPIANTKGFEVNTLPPPTPDPEAPSLVEIIIRFQYRDAPLRAYRLVGVVAPCSP